MGCTSLTSSTAQRFIKRSIHQDLPPAVFGGFCNVCFNSHQIACCLGLYPCPWHCQRCCSDKMYQRSCSGCASDKKYVLWSRWRDPLKRQVPFDVNHITWDVSWCLVGLLTLRIWLLWDLRRWAWCMLGHSLAPVSYQKAFREHIQDLPSASIKLLLVWSHQTGEIAAIDKCGSILWNALKLASFVTGTALGGANAGADTTGGTCCKAKTAWHKSRKSEKFVQPLQPQSSPTQLAQLLVQEPDSPPKSKMSKVNPIFWICLLLEQRTEFWIVGITYQLPGAKGATSSTYLCESASFPGAVFVKKSNTLIHYIISKERPPQEQTLVQAQVQKGESPGTLKLSTGSTKKYIARLVASVGPTPARPWRDSQTTRVRNGSNKWSPLRKREKFVQPRSWANPGNEHNKGNIFDMSDFNFKKRFCVSIIPSKGSVLHWLASCNNHSLHRYN